MKTQLALAPTFISENRLRELVPAAFAEAAHPRVSKSYRFISSTSVVERMAELKFNPVDAMNCRTYDRKSGKLIKVDSPTGPHSITFEPEKQITIGKAGKIGRVQVVMVNSHDRSRRFDLRAGVFRLVCSNGLIAGSTFASAHLTHLQSTTKDLDAKIQAVIDSTGRLYDLVSAMDRKRLDPLEQTAFVRGAMKLRFGKSSNWKIKPEQLLEVRREEDKSDSLWTIFNRVQENLLRGGVRSEATGFTTVPVISPVTNYRVNTTLWDLAETFVN